MQGHNVVEQHLREEGLGRKHWQEREGTGDQRDSEEGKVVQEQQVNEQHLGDHVERQATKAAIGRANALLLTAA